MKRKINKPILLSALALTQGAGAVMLVQNSIVQAYAEQKNKEVTSQEFLDYINQLKEQNSDFKFSQGETKVFESEEQALANLTEQKQAINTAIANYKQAVADRERAYEEAKANVKAQNEQIKQGNEQAEQEYQTKLNAYNAKKAEIEQWKQNNPVITTLDNGIELRCRYDESKKNSIHYFDNIAISANQDFLDANGYETTSKSIKMSPNSTVEVVNASNALIDNTNGYIGGMTLDNYPIKTIKSWRIKAGTPAGELLNMNLRNIGETDSGKVISAHVKFVLDYATSDTPQVSNAEGSINVVKDGLLHMYWLPKSDNSSDKQGGHYEIQFYDDATGQPIKLANTILSIDLDGETASKIVLCFFMFLLHLVVTCVFICGDCDTCEQTIFKLSKRVLTRQEQIDSSIIDTTLEERTKIAEWFIEEKRLVGIRKDSNDSYTLFYNKSNNIDEERVYMCIHKIPITTEIANQMIEGYVYSISDLVTYNALSNEK